MITADGSTTIHITEWDEQYHSKHGAIQEAKHVFIKNGLSLFSDQKISILEIGFGTGLNSFITFLEAAKMKLIIDYVGVEAYPLAAEEVEKMNYVEQLNAKEFTEIFNKMHHQEWEIKGEISPDFLLTKRKQFFNEISDENKFDLIYFDAFGARVQPELWTEQSLEIGRSFSNLQRKRKRKKSDAGSRIFSRKIAWTTGKEGNVERKKKLDIRY